MLHAAWLLNRTPDTTRPAFAGGKPCTPYERLLQTQPDMSKCVIFGADAYAYLHKEQRESKMHEVAIKGFFVGFVPNGAGYRIYSDGKYYDARFVKFDEAPLLKAEAACDAAEPAEQNDGDPFATTDPPSVDKGDASDVQCAPAHTGVPATPDAGDANAAQSSQPLAPNTIIDVYWTKSRHWYRALVRSSQTDTDGALVHRVFYDHDDVTLWHDLSKEKWRLVNASLSEEANAMFMWDRADHGGVQSRRELQAPTAHIIHTEGGSQRTHWTAGGCTHNHTPGDDGDDDPLDPGPFGLCFLASTDRTKHVMTPRGMRSITIPQNHREAMASPYAEEWKKAEMAELDTISAMDTYERHPRRYAQGKSIYRCKWHYDVKMVDGRLDKFKARLVFVGIQQKPDSYSNVFSTCVRYASVRTIIAIGAKRGWVLFNIDIKGAYLYAKMDHELFMHEPPGYEQTMNGEPTVLLVKRALYGAKQSGYLWRMKFDGWMKSYGFERSTHDDCVYVLRGKDSRIVMMAGIWVDDVIAAAESDEVRMEFIAALRKEFTVDDRGELEWALGMKVRYDKPRRRVTLSGEARILALAEQHGVEMKAMRRYATPADVTILEMGEGDELNREGTERAQRLIGALIYISTTCRPDIAHAVYRCATYMSRPNSKVWSAALRILGYLLNTAKRGITYDGKSVPKDDLSALHAPFGPTGADTRAKGHLHLVSDANWEVARSISGYAIMYAGAALTWSCKKQPATALSSTEAETYSASAAVAELLWERELMAELDEAPPGPSTLWVDNAGAVAVAQDVQSVGRSRHIARRANFLHDVAEQGAVRVKWLSTEAMAADVLTKPLDAKKFTKFSSYLMNTVVGE